MLDELKEKFKLDLYAEFERITFKQAELDDLIQRVHPQKDRVITLIAAT